MSVTVPEEIFVERGLSTDQALAGTLTPEGCRCASGR